MPHLQHDNGPQNRACPVSTVLSAFLENQLDGPDRDAVAAHLAQCSECAELHNRLVNFSRSTAATQDAEWENAEKRIEIWMSGFLETHSPAGRTGQAIAENSAKSWWHSWRFQWALSAVAALALIVSGVLLFKSKGNLEGTRVAMQTAAPMASAAPQPTSQVPGEKPPGTQETAASEPVESHSPIASTEPRKTARNPKSKALTAIPEVNGQQPEQAGNSTTAVPSSGESQPEQNTVALAETQAQPAQAPQAAPKRPVLGISPRVPRTQAGVGQGPQTVAETQAPSSPAQSPSQAGPGTTSLSRVPVAPVAPAPAVYRIAADTRLWIKLSAINRQPDGSFTFQGSLLRRSTDANGSALQPGTKIIGSGMVSQGKTSLVVAEIVVGADRYTLKGARGMPNAQEPGGGPAVQFEAGKVLEMFLSSASVYERTLAGSGR